MRVVALLAVRNEERYLERCLRHLAQQGIETWVIDNASTDRSVEIARGFRGRGVIGIEHLPFSGTFELDKQLLFKERLAREIDADWFIHYDADEIREAPAGYATLHDGVAAADARGYNAVDFDEFVFLPTCDEESFEGRDYVEEMRYYYYFDPLSSGYHRLNGWKKTAVVDLHTCAGHQVLFAGLRVFPEPFILRHYMVLSRTHAIEKYANRAFCPQERARSWHDDRAAFRPDTFRFPAKGRLKKLHGARDFDKSRPWNRHALFERRVTSEVENRHPQLERR